MNSYGIVDLNTRTVQILDCPTYIEALTAAGLRSENVDHGLITDYLAVFVYEYGLFKGKYGQYWTLNGHLYEGNAIIYQFDNYSGETINLTNISYITDNIKFFDNIDEVEAAIKKGEVIRPTTSINGEILWQWPSVMEGI